MPVLGRNELNMRKRRNKRKRIMPVSLLGALMNNHDDDDIGDTDTKMMKTSELHSDSEHLEIGMLVTGHLQ